jgi:hypothetical protein
MQKLKRDSQGRVGQGLFLAVWIGGIAITQWISGQVFLWLFSLMTGSLIEKVNPLFLINSLGILVIAFAQVQMVERLLKRSMRGWTLYTIAGVVTTWVLYFFFQLPFFLESLTSWYSQWGFYASTILNVFISTVPTALFQTLWLRRYTQDPRDAWMWPLVIVIISAVSQGLQMYVISNGYTLSSTSNVLPIMNLVTLLLYSVTTGLIMHTLISHPKAVQKAKTSLSDEGDMAYPSRVTRLQEAENAGPSDTSAYQPPKQQSTP